MAWDNKYALAEFREVAPRIMADTSGQMLTNAAIYQKIADEVIKNMQRSKDTVQEEVKAAKAASDEKRAEEAAEKLKIISDWPGCTPKQVEDKWRNDMKAVRATHP